MNEFYYVYNYTDHLEGGASKNADEHFSERASLSRWQRLSYKKNTSNSSLLITNSDDYYPFGLKHNTAVPNNQPNYKYKYQGQERQDELNLNWDSFKWRNYDYAIGRFMSVDPLSEEYSYQSPYNFAENRVIDGNELEGLEWVSSNATQQWNTAFKTLGQSFLGAIDKASAKVSAFFSISRDVAPSNSNFRSKVETTTTATAGTNFLNYANAKQFDQSTTTSPFTFKVETKSELKTEVKAAGKVGGVGVDVKGTQSANLTNGESKTELKVVVGAAKNGVFMTNTSNQTTGKNTTRVGVQVEAETPKVQGTTIKVGASLSVGQDEKK